MLDQQLRRPAAVITYLTNQARWQPGLKLDEAKSQIRNFEISGWTGLICNFGFRDLRFRFVQFQNLLPVGVGLLKYIVASYP